MLLTAMDADHGLELWSTDGTAAHTVLVRDLAAGEGASSPDALIASGGFVYFTATGTGAGQDYQTLWRTDGTRSGTIALAVGGEGVTPTELTAVDKQLFFLGYGPGGQKLYHTDGTVAGTLALATLQQADNLAAVGKSVVFTASDMDHGTELWVSDGTAGGTHLLADVRPGDMSSGIGSVTAFDGKVYFSANSGDGYELWVTDGTSGGTHMVKDIAGGSNWQTRLTAAGDHLFFLNNDGWIWSTDGTEAGTVKVGAAGSQIYSPFAVGDLLFFEGANQGLFVSHGAAGDAVQVGSVKSVTSVAAAGSHTVIAGSQTGLGDGIWVWDGSGAPVRVADGYLTAPMTTSAGQVYFTLYASGASTGYLWVSDGTAGGTHKVDSMGHPGGIAGAYAMTPFEHGVLLRGLDGGGVNSELWFSNGSEYFTSPIEIYQANAADGWLRVGSHLGFSVAGSGDEFFFNAGDNAGDPTSLSGNSSGGLVANLPAGALTHVRSTFMANNTIYFVADTNGDAGELWAYVGAHNTARRVTLTDFGFSTIAGVDNLAYVNGRLYFHATDQTHGSGIFTTDSTAEGTYFLSSVVPVGQPVALGVKMVFYGSYEGQGGLISLNVTNGQTVVELNDQSVGSLTVSGGKAFFSSIGSTSGEELWVTDGTAGGTHLVADLSPGLAFSSPASLLATAGGVTFTADDGTHGRQLWVSDGTQAGTLALSGTATNILSPTVAGSRIYFTANDGSHGQELWVSDGTAGGAHQVADLNAGSGGSAPGSLIADGSALYFTAKPSAGGAGRLYHSDGTLGGTIALTTAANGGAATSLTLVGDKLFFLGSDSLHGSGLFVSDGTAAGTVFIKAFSGAANLTASGGHLYFTAVTAESGGELWISDGTLAGTHQVTETYANPGSFPGDFTLLPNHVESDFNVDGKSDVLWRNDSGEIYIWNSQEGQGAFLGQSISKPSLDWQVQAVGDYDGDAKADILWRNSLGDLYVYKSDAGGDVAFTGQSISYVDPVWAIVPEAGDFNGDGRADILYRNTATGEVYLWNSNGGADVSFTGMSLGGVAANWTIEGIADFNADDRADVLWRSDEGDVYIWNSQAEGPVTMTGQSTFKPDLAWSILGTGDFNGDGHADILWRHTDGEVYVWNSTGSADDNFVGQSLGLVDLDWSVAAIGDYNSDGRADILFRHADGRVFVWNSLDVGAVAFEGQGLGQTPDDWHILSDWHGGI